MSVEVILKVFLLCLVFIQITGVAGASSLAEIGSYNMPGNAIAVSGSYAYVTSGGNGLMIVDISNPAAPELAGIYNTAGQMEGVAVLGSYAYVADFNNGLVIVDISNPAAPALAGNYDTTGFGRGVAVSGSYAYFADAIDLAVIDISNPAAPALVGNYNTPGYAKGVVVSGGYAYVADSIGLAIIDIRNPTAPALVGSYNTENAWGVAVSGSYAYIADYDNGLVIVDIRNPAAPVLAGSYDTAGEARGVVVSGDYAYIADSIGLAIIDIRNPAAPALVSSYNTGSAWGVAVSGSYTYVADWFNGLIILGESGAISVSSSPSGANVYLDGAYEGTTPYTVSSVSAGSHIIKLTKTGYVDMTQTVNVVSGGTIFVSETLVLIPPPTGSISVSSSPSGVNVYLDGAYKGTTPSTITSVSAGSHIIKLTKIGYVDITKPVDVVSGGTTYASETLALIPQPVGSISVSSSPSGASVYLDGAYKGTTPLTIESISIGNHALKLVKDGYSDKTKLVIITKDNTKKVSTLLVSSEVSPVKSTNSIDTNAPETDNKKSDAVGGIGAILSLLFLISIVATIRKKSKHGGQSISPHSGNSTTSTKTVSPYQDNITEPISTQPISAPKIASTFGYKGATIQYKVKVENPTSEPIADIKINLYVPDVFLASESTKTITMLKPSESKTVTFEIRPTGECGDCEVSGKVVYYDYSTKKTTGIDIPPKSLSIVCPMLKGMEIGEPEWHSIVSNLIETEESTREIDMPAETLFTMASRIVKDMHMHRLEPEITNTQQLFNGVARFYGEGVKGLKYAAQVEVVGDAKKSRLILKTWAEKEEALTGFYHGLLDEIEKRVPVKGYIDDSIVQNFYHYGDKIGTQVKDSIVQRSNIGAGGDVAERKCPECGTVAEGNGKYCNGCGGKL